MKPWQRGRSRAGTGSRQRSRGSALITELLVAMALVTGALVPLSLVVVRDMRALRAEYHRAAAMELVNGELEVLRAGAWRAWPEGVHEYPVSGWAVTNLAEGRFTLTRAGRLLRLEWAPARRQGAGRVVYECELP